MASHNKSLNRSKTASDIEALAKFFWGGFARLALSLNAYALARILQLESEVEIMPRNMSFMLTTQQILNKTKTVTRRLGWEFLKPGTILNACEKCMGLKKGEQVKKLCQIRVVDVKREPLWNITDPECKKEGFPEMCVHDFVRMFRREMKCKSDVIVTRIEFEYV